MNRIIGRLALFTAFVFGLAAASLTYQLHAAQAAGPLSVHPQNPRYFTDGSKLADGSLRAVYLTGAHTWNNLVDMGRSDPPEKFDCPYDGSVLGQDRG